MKNYTRMFREANPGDGGGTPPLPPSLADIDIVKTPTDLSEAQQQAAAAEEAYNALVAEATNEDGSLKDGYVKGEDGKISKADATPPAGDGGEGGADPDPADEDEEGSFWEDVDKLHGTTLDINWDDVKDADGNPIDPVSPEGAYHREKVIRQQAIDAFEAHLKATDPRGYAYLLHRQAGGSDEDFLAVKAANLPEYEAFKESTDSQAALYKAALIERGLDPELAQAQVDKAIKDGKLFDLSDKEYKAQQAANQKQLDEIEARNKQATDAYTASVNKLNTTITSTINEGKGLKIVIPDADKAGFTDFVKQGVRYDPETKSFSLVQELGEDNARLLESMYLLYKKGNLKDLVVRQAQTENVKRLRRTIDKSKTDAVAGKADAEGGKPKYVPMGQI